MAYNPPRPIRKRWLAENEAIRHAVRLHFNEWREAKIPVWAICRAAKVTEIHLSTYIKHCYLDYSGDPDNYDQITENFWKAKNNRRYISDEAILRLCDLFRIEIEVSIKLNPRRYETRGEWLHRMAEEQWKNREVGVGDAAENRAWVD